MHAPIVIKALGLSEWIVGTWLSDKYLQLSMYGASQLKSQLYMTLVSDSNIKHWSLSAAHC